MSVCRLVIKSYFFLQPVYQDILQHEPTVHHVLKTARDILKDKKPSEERDTLQNTVDDVEKRWKNVREKVTKRRDQILRIMPQAVLYNNELENVKPWLEEAEKQVKALPKLSVNPEDFSQRKREVQVKAYLQLKENMNITKPQRQNVRMNFSFPYDNENP